jgi:hypothetical protein
MKPIINLLAGTAVYESPAAELSRPTAMLQLTALISRI